MQARPFAIYAIKADPYGCHDTPPDPGLAYRRWLVNQPGFESAELIREGAICHMTRQLVCEHDEAQKRLNERLPDSFWEDEDGDEECPDWEEEDLRALSGLDTDYNRRRPQTEVRHEADPDIGEWYRPLSETRIEKLVQSGITTTLHNEVGRLLNEIAVRLIQLSVGVDLTVFTQGLLPILRSWVTDKVAQASAENTPADQLVTMVTDELKTLLTLESIPVRTIGSETIKLGPDCWFIPLIRDKTCKPLPKWVYNSWLRWAFLRNRSLWGVAIKHGTGYVYLLLDNRSGDPFLMVTVRNKASTQPEWKSRRKPRKGYPTNVAAVSRELRQQRMLPLRPPLEGPIDEIVQRFHYLDPTDDQEEAYDDRQRLTYQHEKFW